MNADIFCLIGFGVLLMLPFFYLNYLDHLPDIEPDTEIDWWVPIEHFFGEDE